jgi:predicted permease
VRLRLKQQRLLELLARSALSQNHWALKVGLSRGHWSEIVNGKHLYPSAKTRVQMLDALQVPLEELFDVETGIDPLTDIDFRRAIADRCLIDTELGQGGMGAVYLGRDVRHGRVVAVKVVSPEAVSGIGLTQFHREISTVAQLHHQNILPLYDSGDAAGHPFYVMPWVRGGSLRARLQQDIRLSLPSTLRLTRGIAAALHHAHSERVLHCDVKPENVLLNGDHAWVMDFGIARKLHSEIGDWTLRKELDTSAGTPAYVSPEQASGDPNLDARSDVYSLGCMVYEMLAGRTPFGGTSTRQIVATRFIVPPPPLSDIAPEIPPAVSSVLERAMALPREQRPDSAAAFANELVHAATQTSRIFATVSLTASRAIGRARRRLRRQAPHTAGGTVLEFLRDISLTMRSLRTRPAFTATVAATLALGIGANAAMFGILDRLLFRAPPHVVEPERVVQIHTRRLGSQSVQTSQPYRLYKELLQNVSDFQSVAISTQSPDGRRSYYPLGRGTSATRVAGAQVTPSFFATLGVRPWLGRFFTEQEAGEENPQKLAVISHGFWQRHFAGRSTALGETLDLGSDRYTVTGVLPAGFSGAGLGDVDVWIPIAAADGLRFIKGPEWRTTLRSQWVNIYARLAPNANVARARGQATTAYRASDAIRAAERPGAAPSNPDSLEVLFGSVIPGQSPRTSGVSAKSGELRVSRLLTGVSFLVLLLACANVANLLLVRALNRRREIAVRLALGISRRRLVGQLLGEGMLLSLLGAVGALMIVQFGSGFIRRLLLGDAAWGGSAVDLRVATFTGIVAIGTGLLTSLVPALQASNPDITQTLKAGVREGGAARSRTRAILLGTQAALALLLLAGAGLFVRSLRQVAALPFGVDVDRVLVASIEHTSTGLSNAQALDLYLRFAERAREVPGITAAAASIAHSFGLGWGATLFASGQRLVPPGSQGFSQYAITPEYFRVMGIRLIAGRQFDERDRAGNTLVAIINETAARTYWPNANAVGQCVQVGADTLPCTTIVGIVTNARRQQLLEDPIPQIYRPLTQLPPSVTDGTVSIFGYTLLLRTARRPQALVEPVRQVLQATAATVPYAHVRPLSENVSRHTRSWSLGATMFSVFGAVALVLAVVGLYSVVTFNLAQRVHEYGVRRALGATGSHLVRITMARGLIPVIAGILAGLLIAVASANLVASLLFETSPRDPTVLAGVSAVLLTASVLGSLLPGVRAAKADPVRALRSE